MALCLFFYLICESCLLNVWICFTFLYSLSCVGLLLSLHHDDFHHLQLLLPFASHPTPPPTFSLFKRATNASLSHLLFLYVDCRFQFWIICITMFTIFAKSKMWIESTDFAGNGNRFEMVFSLLFLKYILHSEWILKHNKICMILSFLYELINFSNQFEGVSFVVICSCAWVKRGSVWN